ncbi:glycoside hydrolase family 43 protein [Niabella sp. CC-SYL272]|uniref:glycoside hydrolase family 43 protein n=1 Tax=Niabella agricola TaxID=2891571 RepID=UPI001F1F2D58|nr:glycoside hydrolase family 43 protein [Niabella agricola]MCF3109237.1 glycoside hydrolase family 43 protein [Niabella agricola]
MTHSGNPIIRHLFTADPTALVFKDRVYLYTGHDEAPAGTEAYVMNDWRCFSSADLLHWKEHAHVLKATDFKWASGGAYATSIIRHNDHFYWYVAVNHKTIEGSAIGVAVSDAPDGKFHDALNGALITRDMLPPTDNEKINLDPSVIIDDDGTGYIFWGNKICHYAKLRNDLLGLSSEIQQLDLPGFEEGAHIHKKNGWYYLSYGYGMPEKVAYAMSRSIHGPWQFKGILNELAGNCATNRPCIVDFKGRSYFFYHNGGLKNGGSHRRSVCADDLFYNEDGTMRRIIMTSEGVIV